MKRVPEDVMEALLEMEREAEAKAAAEAQADEVLAADYYLYEVE